MSSKALKPVMRRLLEVRDPFSGLWSAVVLELSKNEEKDLWVLTAKPQVETSEIEVMISKLPLEGEEHGV